MDKNKDRHIFLGGNTSEGFCSFFDHIIDRESAKKIICLKGGPGTGKSSLMKKIAFHFNTLGYNIEQFHCSSDDHSLDGVAIQELGFAIVDGTAPHIVDPEYPGALDKIVDLAVALNKPNMVPHKDEIMALNSAISNLFKRAYKYFNAASVLYKDWADLNYSTLDKNKLAKLNLSINDSIFPNCRIAPIGKKRHLFSTAFSPNGVVSYLDTLVSDLNSIYILKGEPGLCKSELLTQISNTAIEYGYNVELYHNTLLPEKLAHIIIPELNIGVFSQSEISKLNFTGTIFNLTDLCDQSKLISIKEEIDFNKAEFELLLDKGLSLITQAKSLHDKLETYYVGNMDFNKINDIFDEIVKEVEALI
ncbi:MAG: PRK06851 family protein [Clostridium sp.]